jgi:Ser/Thr protein kinase RdoA (MazF antagonist)
VPALTFPSAGSVAAEQELVGQVTRWFGLGGATRVRRVAEGLMNRNWQAITPAGTVAVKQVIDAPADAVRAQHVAVTALARAGLPVPAPVAGPAGVTVLEHPAGLFTVLPWAAGRHRSGLSLRHDECGMLGALLGRLHAALARTLPSPREEVPVAVTPVTAASERMARYRRLAEQNRHGDDFDRLVLRRLGERAGLLESLAHLRPADQVWSGPAGWTHGDFHHLQVLWDDGRVSAVLDWDRLGVRPLAAEVVRSGTLLFGYGDSRGLDTGRVTAFARGYRQLVALADADLADAVHRLWWERLCDFWQLKWHYERGDHSCDHLFASASALLEWWCAHRAAVSSAFTS